jgi:hypothetical protein
MNNETQHTAGPWKTYDEDSTIFITSGEGYLSAKGSDEVEEKYICEVRIHQTPREMGLHQEEERRANAHLIASAPSLLKENQELRNDLYNANCNHSRLDTEHILLKKENQELKEQNSALSQLNGLYFDENNSIKSINEELIKMLTHAVEWIEEMHGETHDSKIYKDLLFKAKPQTTPSN